MDKISLIALLLASAFLAAPAAAQDICAGFGPQAPRDISMKDGTNPEIFHLSDAADQMSLCDIHAHNAAEHKGPGFSVEVSDGTHSGFGCNESGDLTDAEMTPVEGAFEGAQPGDTIEVHWVYTTCEVEPGPGLASCVSDRCVNPQLRVESQVFLLVNDPAALDFAAFSDIQKTGTRYQTRALPTDTGTPVVFAGSTTGPSFTNAACSPYEVTWSVRPQCAKLDINSLNRWAADNPFEEDHAHGIRELVTAPELLSAIK